MSMAPGIRLGPYEILAPIGAGGMGEVFRARDTRLGRDVAIKVLPAAFAQDAERVARFRREAQVLASLHHPNVAAIFGLEESDGTLAIAMELVEGEDLAKRLMRGAIPVDEAIAIAAQIIDGLEAAHEKGIVHRDLKPANIKLRPDGAVKVLDFGLARAYGDTGSQTEPDSSQSPTVARPMTESGVILGTAAYMSPEQARGKPVDKRADIWAFGVVLFEMLAGRKLFASETVSDTLAAVLTREVDWTNLPASTPEGVRRLLERCLDRNPKTRLRDIGDARLDLAARETGRARTPPASRRKLLRLLPLALAITSVVIAAWALWHRTGAAAPSSEVTYLDIGYPPGVEPWIGHVGFAIAPDGRTIGMVGVGAGVRRLFLRRLDRADAVEVSHGISVNSVAFSPDSRNVAILPGTAVLTRYSIEDQHSVALARGTDVSSYVAWGASEVLYNRGGSIWLVPSKGGESRRLTKLDATRDEVLHADSMVLPKNRFALFTSVTTEAGGQRIEAVRLDSGERSVILEHANTPKWSPTGHLLFGRDGAVWAVPLDPETATVRGAAVRVIPPGVIGTIGFGSMGFQLSSNGTLVYIPERFATRRVVSVGRDGSELALALPAERYGNPRISPDGRRLLMETNGTSIDALDLSRGTRTRLSGNALGVVFGHWTADGNRVVFKRFALPWWASADGSGKSGPVPSTSLNDFPSSAGPDPDSIITNRIDTETSADIFLMSVSGRFPPTPLIRTPAYEAGPHLSPDKRWLAHQSNESGRHEIYVRRYPGLDRAWQVSEGGGVQTRWSTNGRELYYRNGRQIMAVSFDPSGSEPSFGKPTGLFADEYDYGQGLSIANYDVTPEGRFILLRSTPNAGSLRVVMNWTEELKRILAEGGVR